MATASREGAIFIASLFGALTLYFLWGAVAGTPISPDSGWLNHVGAAMFGLFALHAARVARHPERYDPARTSTIDRLIMGIEALSCLAAALYGIHWLITKVT